REPEEGVHVGWSVHFGGRPREWCCREEACVESRSRLTAYAARPRWRLAFDQLITVGRVVDAARLLEAQVPELVSERRHPELAAAVQRLPSEERSLLLRLAVADGSLEGHRL